MPTVHCFDLNAIIAFITLVMKVRAKLQNSYADYQSILLYCFMIVIRCLARPLNGRYNDDLQFRRQLRTMFFSLQVIVSMS